MRSKWSGMCPWTQSRTKTPLLVSATTSLDSFFDLSLSKISLPFHFFSSPLERFYVSQEYGWCPNIFFFCPDIFVLFWKFPEYLFSGSLDFKWRPPSGYSRYHINLGCFKLYHLLLLPHKWYTLTVTLLVMGKVIPVLNFVYPLSSVPVLKY